MQLATPLALLTAGLFLFGCASTDVHKYASVDQSEKTITVPPGSGGLLGPIKQELADQGWKAVVYRGPNVTEGSLGEKTRIESYSTFNSRYRLLLRDQRVDYCVPVGGPMYRFDISVIDNKSGSELLTMSGRGCETTIVDKFKDALKG